MLEILKSNKEYLQNSTKTYKCEEDIYGILLKTGKYFNAKDIFYQNIKIIFLIKIIFNK